MLSPKTSYLWQCKAAILIQQFHIVCCLYSLNGYVCVCMCVYSNSRKDVPRVAQRYGTIAAHTRRRASVLVVFVVFCVHMHSFAGLIRLTQSPIATLIPLFSSSELTGCGYPGLLDRKNHSDMCPPVGVEPSSSCMQGEHLIH